MKNMKADEIVTALMLDTFTAEELQNISEALAFRRQREAAKALVAFKVGSVVKFTNPRLGRTVVGKIRRIMRKNVIVDVGLERWRVPADKLSAA